jgi:serine/threonine protein phosphatase PrpC
MVAGFRNAKDGESHSAVLPRLVQQANALVFETAVAGGRGFRRVWPRRWWLARCAIDRVSVAHVGDSRCYLIRNGKAAQITRDHTIASEQVRLGLVTAQEAAEGSDAAYPQPLARNRIGCQCGYQRPPDIRRRCSLLCSDGLHGAVEASEMAALCGHGQDLHLAAEKLVALANDRGGGDNISVQLIRIRDVERMGMYRGRPYKLY